MTEQHRLILRVARVFGECELDMPHDFETEINQYIKYWQSSEDSPPQFRPRSTKATSRPSPTNFCRKASRPSFSTWRFRKAISIPTSAAP